MDKRIVIAWWSGGITSALACYWAVQTFKDVEVVFIDTKNEDEDTYRFLKDCETLYGQEIIRITRLGNNKFKNDYQKIQDVWDKYESLNNAKGAICSTELKREVREAYQNLDIHWGQVFGFEYEKSQIKRHYNMRRNYPEINVISPLIDSRINKEDSSAFFREVGIDRPKSYDWGFENNNCLKTGCVRGGIGYWKKYRKFNPKGFNEMADREHRYTNSKGKPVTICKDQSVKPHELVFLRKHPDYPDVKTIDDIKGIQPKPVMECFGFCATNVG